MLSRLFIITGSLAALVVPSSALAAPSNETLWLDTHTGPASGIASVSTNQPLVPGALYVAEVSGTYSIWTAAQWLAPGPTCGTPEAAPAYPSPGVVNSKVGLDAASMFAAVPRSVFCRPGTGFGPVPKQNTAFQIDQGNGPRVTTPVGGVRITPDASHTYSFVLTGQGAGATFRFVSVDSVGTDNYGQLQIKVAGTTQDDCKKDGWRRFGLFKNQGDCVSYQATNARNAPAGA